MIGRTISHYEILAQIGKGGMGVVYQARDLNLERLVALKFLPRELSTSKEKKQRFIQEARAASALDHPNICTIHEIGETDDGQLFIAMASYEGETLKDKLLRGPLLVAEILDLAEQLAVGLAAAHKQGLSHLDIKPANVLVTNKGVVKILDFGLAQFSGEAPELSSSGAVMGTVAYMAPERVLGQEVSPQTDIWALGAVLYEMSTGQKPFQGLDKTEVLYAIVRENPTRPIDVAPELPPELDEIIYRSLIKNQKQRYQSVAELLDDLDSLTHPSRATDLSALRGRPWLGLGRPEALMAVVAAVVVFMLWWTFSALVGKRPELDGSSGVLLLGFQNRLDPTAEWLGAALSELLVLELPASESLLWVRPIRSVAPGSQSASEADRLRWLASLDPERGLTGAALEEARRKTAASLLVAGVYHRDGERLKVRLLVQDLLLGTLRKQRTFDGSRQDLLKLAATFADSLAADFATERARAVSGKSQLDARTAHLLSMGREKRQHLDAAAAREIYLAGDVEVPELALAQTDVLLELGRDSEARQRVGAALAKSRRMAGEMRVRLKARFFESGGELAAAAALLRSLWESRPAEAPLPPEELAERGIHLARILAVTGESQAAEELADELWGIVPMDGRVALVEAEAARHRGLYRNQAKSAKLAQALAHQDGASPLVIARAALVEGQTLLAQGRLEPAAATLATARDAYDAHDDPRGEAEVSNALGDLYRARGDLEAAADAYDTAIQLYEELGNRRFMGWPKVGRALVDLRRGDLAAAVGGFRQARGLLRGTTSLAAEATALVQLGDAETAAGNLTEATVSYQEALDLLRRDRQHPRIEASALASQGELLFLLGDLAKASQTLDQALEIQRQIEDPKGLARSLIRQAQLHQRGGNLALARRQRQEALELCDALGDADLLLAGRGAFAASLWADNRLTAARLLLESALADAPSGIDPLTLAESRLTYAGVLLALGRFEDARGQASETLASQGETPSLAAAAAGRVLAESLLALGKLDAAQQEIDRALALPRGGEEHAFLRLPLQITAARILTARLELGRARELLDQLLAAATTGRLVEWELEIRLQEARFELKTGSRRLALSRFGDIETEAEGKEFDWIAAMARRERY